MNSVGEIGSSVHEERTVVDEAGTPFGYFVVDSEIGGRSCGGLRMAADLTLEELRALARQMTMKFGFLNIGLGGAKTGIVVDPEENESRKRDFLQKLGKAISPWLVQGKYIPGFDVGTREEDVKVLLESAGDAAIARIRLGSKGTEATALTVFAAMRAASSAIGLSLDGARIGIEGFGGVGTALARLLVGAGAKIVATSTKRGSLFNLKGISVNQLIDLKDRFGSRCVEMYRDGEFLASPGLTAVPLDVYSSCARYHSITRENVASLSTRLICGGSNLQVLPGVEQILQDRSILYVPPYVANCGGVFWGSLQVLGMNFDEFQEVVLTRFEAGVRKLLVRSIQQGVPPIAITDEIAHRRIQNMKVEEERRSFRNQLWRIGRVADLKGLVPLSIKRYVGQRQIMRSLQEWC